jgi:hypothetical protein
MKIIVCLQNTEETSQGSHIFCQLGKDASSCDPSCGSISDAIITEGTGKKLPFGSSI